MKAKGDSCFLKENKNRTWMEYLFLNILVLVGLTLILELWRTNIFRYPINSGGDATQTLYGNKLLSETWLFGYSKRISYPYYAYMSDFPNSGIFINTIRWIEFGLISNSAFAINLIYIIGYLLSASTAYWSLRKLEITKMVAGVVAIMYAFLPFHFMRNIAHLTIGMYWPVPIFLYSLINYLKGNNGYVRNQKGHLCKDSILHIAILFVLGGHSVYYTYFSCFFVCVTIVLLVIRKEQWAIIKQAIVDLAVLLGTLSITVIVYVINVFRYGGNDSVAVRKSGDVETYALKIGQLLMPVKGHRLSFLADWKADYNKLPLTTENEMATLGILFSVGFILLIVELIKKTHEDEDVYICSSLNIAAVLLATVGGVSSIIATFFAQIRCYNRISVFIAFLAAVCFAKVINKYALKISSQKIYIVICVIVLAIGIFDQTTQSFIPNYESINAEWDSDKKFVSYIEEIEGEGAKIYQMPYTYYPESTGVNNMAGYDLTKGYIHSKTLVWSFGAYKGREGDVWNSYVSSLDLEEQVQAIFLNGFDGIYVDSYGFTKDEFPTVIDELEKYTQSFPSVSDNGRLYYFSLCNYDKEGISENDIILSKIFMEYGEGVYDVEKSGDEYWNWCQSDAFINIYNKNEEKSSIIITTTITTLIDEGNYEVIVKLNDEIVDKVSIVSGENNFIKIPIILEPGKNVLSIESNIPQVELSYETRDLAFCVHNFTYSDPRYQEIDCEEGGSYMFGLAGNSDRLLITNGLSGQENGYAWTEGNQVEMYCNFGDEEKVYCAISQVLQITEMQHVKVLVDGKTVFNDVVKSGEDIIFTFDNTAEDMTYIKIILPDAISPSELGMSKDERKLAIALRSISFSSKASNLEKDADGF